MKRLNISEIINIHYKKLALIVAVFLFVAFDVILAFSIYGPEEAVYELASDEITTVTFPFDRIEAVSFSNNDVSKADKLENSASSVKLEIYDENSEAAIIYALDITIHTNAFSNVENGSYEGLPCVVQTGKEYKLVMNGGIDDIRLTVAFYGNNKSFGRIMLPVFAGQILILFASLLMNRNRVKRSFVMYMCGIGLICVFLMPTIQTGEEMQSFADVYSVSSKLLGKEAAEPGKMAVMYESGLLNTGYTTYRTPLFRFWNDKKYGNEITEGMPCTVYVRSDLPLSLSQFPAVIGISVARLLKMSYRGVLLSGWAMEFMSSLIMLTAAISIIENSSQRKRRLQIDGKMNSVLTNIIVCIGLIPSMVFGSFSYSGIGVAAAMLILVLTVLICSDAKSIKILSLICAVFALLSIMRFIVLVLDTDVLMVIGNEAADRMKPGIMKSFIYADRTLVELISYRGISYNSPLIPVWSMYLVVVSLVYRFINGVRHKEIISETISFDFMSLCTAITVVMSVVIVNYRFFVL